MEKSIGWWRKNENSRSFVESIYYCMARAQGLASKRYSLERKVKRVVRDFIILELELERDGK